LNILEIAQGAPGEWNRLVQPTSAREEVTRRERSLKVDLSCKKGYLIKKKYWERDLGE